MNEGLEDHDDVDMYALLGVNTNVSTRTGEDATTAHDPLAAFMDDDENEAETTTPDSDAAVDVETLLTTLVRDLLDEERLDTVAPGARIANETVLVHRDRDAYHLSLIVDMGGTPMRPFATVLSTDRGVLPLNAPTGLHRRWKPLYDTLQHALVQALRQHRATGV